MADSIPMNPLCPRCGGQHGVEVAGDGSEWDCAQCGGHLLCAIGLDGGEMFPYHREDGSCGCEGEPHTCGDDERTECALCSYGGVSEEPTAQFAVWLHNRGWLIDVCGEEANVADRLYAATWFSTEDEARAVLASVTFYAEPDDVGTVVTL